MPPAREITVRAARDPWYSGAMDGWVPDSVEGDLDIFDGFELIDLADDFGIVWDLRFTVPVTCPHPLVGETPETRYLAGSVIPAGVDINPPVPNEGSYTFTEVL